jgi:hypothetical protein
MTTAIAVMTSAATGHGEDHRAKVACGPRARLLDAVHPVERVHRRAHGARELPGGQQRAAGHPEQLLGLQHAPDGVVDHGERGGGDRGRDLRPQVLAPDLGEVEEAEQAEREEHQRHERGQHLEGDRAREQQEVVALEARDEPGQLPRERPQPFAPERRRLHRLPLPTTGERRRARTPRRPRA